LGTLRRHPEGKWQKEEGAIRFFSDLQLRLLKKGVSLLKKGGVLVYSVCTFTKEETDEVVDRLLKSSHSEGVGHSEGATVIPRAQPEESDEGLQIEPLSGILPKACAPFFNEKDREREKGTFLALPTVGGMDGFFIARFIRH
jgi:16S rRNA C967 or C1407 C5-methylase (RsmB/RsmF family)